MRIGVDLDNVLNNLNDSWLKMYSQDYKGHELSIEDIKSWDIHSYTKNGKGIYSYLNNDLFRNLKPIDNAYEVTKELSKNNELFVVTASEPCHVEVKQEWVSRHFPHIKESNFISTYRKDLIDVDILIDDAPHNIVNFPNWAIVLDYAWNRDLDSIYTRARNWKNIYGIIQSAEKDFNYTHIKYLLFNKHKH